VIRVLRQPLAQEAASFASIVELHG
jgi:hypothetical protein